MRVVTRADLDGLTCAVLLCRNEDIQGIRLYHPQDISDGRAEIGPQDIIANLPYDPRCALWFDHHLHTATPNVPLGFKGAFAEAPSAARLVYEYYGGEEAMPQFAALVRETDRLDSAQLSPHDVLLPKGYIKLGFTIDGRTGLGEGFESYFMNLVDLLKLETPIGHVLQDPEVLKRTRRLDAENDRFERALRQFSQVEDNVVITDLRALEQPPVGNRFLVYALFPEVNVSVRLHWGPNRSFPMLLLGHSIFNRTCRTNVGELAARYGGGGHRGAASIPLMDEPEQLIRMVINELKTNG